jgi:hypothetical protein
MMEYTDEQDAQIEDILNELAYEGCRLFTWPLNGAWMASMDFPETHQRWQLDAPRPTHAEAIIAMHHQWRMDGHNTPRRTIDEIYARDPGDD